MWSDKIKTLLSERDIDQKDFAGKLGIHEQTMSRWLNNSNLQTSKIEKICKALGVPLIDVLFDDEEVAKILNISPSVLEISRKIDKLNDDSKIDFLEHIKTGLKLVRK